MSSARRQQGSTLVFRKIEGSRQRMHCVEVRLAALSALQRADSLSGQSRLGSQLLLSEAGTLTKIAKLRAEGTRMWCRHRVCGARGDRAAAREGCAIAVRRLL